MIPRNFFPNMPDEMFNEWLQPIANHYGWPFNSPYDSIKDTDWYYLLCRMELLYWITVKWNKTAIPFESIPFSYNAYFAFESIIDQWVKGLPTPFTHVQRSEERFWACADYIRLHGQIPGSIIVILRNGRFDMVDGTHRIAALLHIGGLPDYEVPLWYPVKGHIRKNK